MEAHEEDRERIQDALLNGYMVMEQRTGRTYIELGEGRRVKQEWEAAPVTTCACGATAIGIIHYEDLGGLPSSVRTDDIIGMWENSARGRAAHRVIQEILDAEEKATKNWDEK